MKDSNDVMWLTGYGPNGNHIIYTHEQYTGATTYSYGWVHLPTKKRGESKIFGVTEKGGNELVKRWDNCLPELWKYFPLNPQFINQ